MCLEDLSLIAKDNKDDIDHLADETRKILPEYTCPKIDKIIKAIRSIEKIVNKPNRYENAEQIASDVESELWGMEDMLEELRRSNDTLRNLSEEWRYCAEVNQNRLDKKLTMCDANHLTHPLA